ncbi:MAG: DUF11 domain-containing protein, partial [Acidobacteriota bacterium]|nr:DUF11 domain-containing protein [Acidobacteriota bacterium]
TSTQDDAPDDQEDNPVTTPELSLDKTGTLDLGMDNQANPGDVITYTFTVANTGTANLTNVVVSDPLVGLSAIDCGPPDNDNVIDRLDAGSAAVICTATYSITLEDINAGVRNNTATASSDQAPNDTADATVPIPQVRSIEIQKVFAQDSLIAGGSPGSFTLLVENTGNVTLTNVTITDIVDSKLTVTDVSGAPGFEVDNGGLDDNNIEWMVASLDPDGTVTIAVTFDVESYVVATDDLLNTADVTGEAPQGENVIDDANDTIDILVDITLAIEKLFDPVVIEVPQGTGQEFTIEVTNSGPSDAVDVMVTDTLNSFLWADSVMVVAVDGGTGSGTCTVDPVIPAVPPLPPTPQMVDCTLQIPANESVLITVTYIVAPFLSGDQIFGDGTGNGAEFRFVFDNGSILEGNALGPVYLDGMLITAAGDPGLTKNDYIFDPPGDGPFDQPFELHLSCSDAYTGGWGQSGGPDPVDNPDWQIDYFSIARYKKTNGEDGSFFRSCGNVVDIFEVDNTATAIGTDSYPDTCPPEDECTTGPAGTGDPECDEVCDTASVTIKEGILLDKFQKKAKHGSVNVTNLTDMDKEIKFLELIWPTSNGDLRQVTLDGTVIWQGNAPGVSEPLSLQRLFIGDMPEDEFGNMPAPPLFDPTPWSGGPIARTLEADVAERLAFHFDVKADEGAYQIRMNFADGTFLDIFIPSGGSGGGSAVCGDAVCDPQETCTCEADCGPAPSGNQGVYLDDLGVSMSSMDPSGDHVMLGFDDPNATSYTVHRSHDASMSYETWTGEWTADLVDDMDPATAGHQWLDMNDGLAPGEVWYYMVEAISPMCP